MPTMTVDLNDLDDLMHAQSVIHNRIAELGGPVASEKAVEDGRSGEVEGDEGLPTGDTTQFAEDFWASISSPNTKNLIWAFTNFDGAFTLEDVAEKLGLSPHEVRAKKLRLGRTEKKLRHRLLDSDWAAGGQWMYYYEMVPEVRQRLRKLLIEESDRWPLSVS